MANCLLTAIYSNTLTVNHVLLNLSFNYYFFLMFNISLPLAEQWQSWWLGGSEPLVQWRWSEDCAETRESWMWF